MCRILVQIYTTAVRICRQVMYNKGMLQSGFKHPQVMQQGKNTGQLTFFLCHLQFALLDFTANCIFFIFICGNC